MTLALVALYSAGLVFAVAFLARYLPRRWYSAASLNGAGWILIVVITFARALALLALRGGPQPARGWLDTVISLGSLAAVDVLVLLRLVSYLRWRRAG